MKLGEIYIADEAIKALDQMKFKSGAKAYEVSLAIEPVAEEIRRIENIRVKFIKEYGSDHIDIGTPAFVDFSKKFSEVLEQESNLVVKPALDVSDFAETEATPAMIRTIIAIGLCRKPGEA